MLHSNIVTILYIGISLHTFHGNFFVRSTDLLSLPNVNPDHGFCMNLAIDENLKEYSTICCQAALLYTTYRGALYTIQVHLCSLHYFQLL